MQAERSEDETNSWPAKQAIRRRIDVNQEIKQKLLPFWAMELNIETGGMKKKLFPLFPFFLFTFLRPLFWLFIVQLEDVLVVTNPAQSRGPEM